MTEDEMLAELASKIKGEPKKAKSADKDEEKKQRTSSKKAQAAYRAETPEFKAARLIYLAKCREEFQAQRKEGQ